MRSVMQHSFMSLLPLYAFSLQNNHRVATIINVIMSGIFGIHYDTQFIESRVSCPTLRQLTNSQHHKTRHKRTKEKMEFSWLSPESHWVSCSSWVILSGFIICNDDPLVYSWCIWFLCICFSDGINWVLLSVFYVSLSLSSPPPLNISQPKDFAASRSFSLRLIHLLLV